MKRFLSLLFLILLLSLLVGLILSALPAFAQDAATNAVVTPASSPLTPDASPVSNFISGLLGKQGWITTVILIIGSLRILFKPVMLAIENVVKQTSSTSDDANLAKFEGGPVYKTISTLLDFGASIKLPQILPPGPPK